jgi:hypothetical protein
MRGAENPTVRAQWAARVENTCEGGETIYP